MIRNVYKIVRMINSANAMKRGTYGKYASRRFIRKSIRRLLR